MACRYHKTQIPHLNIFISFIGPHLPINWGTRVWTSSWDHCRSVSTPCVDVCCESTGNVHLGKGGLAKPSGKRRRQEEASGIEDWGADERGEEGAVDGLPPGTRLGKEGPMPWCVNENTTKYFLKHNLCIYSKIHWIFHCISFHNKWWKKKIYFIAVFCLWVVITD